MPVDAAKLGKIEEDARKSWSALDDPQPAVVDEDGQRVEPSERLREINRRARIIVISNTLAGLVRDMLGPMGVTVSVYQVRVEPVVDDVQVLSLRTEDGRVVPIRPAARVLRVWQDGGEIELEGQPVAEVPVEVEPDGWALAARITEALEPHLR